ncbi:hypothetical protein MLD38_017989 [Melastoma candidum]|uniref:Uncharacterized protein n=1 Tax=Melastoma candidum TaxID=119954 RepID=A0ACB9QTJ1_9MYRT|nr:hypothetical protein MLD38_017989 [Melastoma candidum]
MDSIPTELDYFTEMSKLRSESTVVSFVEDDSRCALVLASTTFHPQGGGQPADTGFIEVADSGAKFVVEDVRSRDGIVFHYCFIENVTGDCRLEFSKGKEVRLQVDKARRQLNSRLHSAGHLIDACLKNVGLGHLEPGKGYHFPDGPFVEYKGVIPQNELQSKQMELEIEVNKIISRGGHVAVAILSYEEASKQCGGSLPHYIAKDSTPRIVTVGNHSCPCGGTHVIDLKELISIKVTQIRVKKGMTKVSYTVG